MISKLLAIPALLVTSLMWLVVKAVITIYGLCYGLLGIGMVAALIFGISRMDERWCSAYNCSSGICNSIFRNLYTGAFGRSKLLFKKNY